MSIGVAADYVKIGQLVDKIAINMDNITNETRILEDKLETLEQTFKDSGSKIVRNHIEYTKEQIDKNIGNFSILCEKLTEYAGHLKDTRDSDK